ncbi:MAG: hypothetical protein ACRD12_13040, partial [Acidimicrobiales bacterium]
MVLVMTVKNAVLSAHRATFREVSGTTQEPVDSPSTPAAGEGYVDRPDLVPQLQRVEGADPELVEIGNRYWALRGFPANPAAESGLDSADWVEPSGDIAADAGETASRLYVLAAAGVTAVLPAYKCPRCEAPLQLRSRSALDQVAKGRGTADCCARCNETLHKALERLKDPATRDRRREARAQAESRQRQQEAARAAALVRRAAAAQWASACDDLLESTFPIVVASQGGLDWTSLGARARVEAGVLAMLYYAPTPAPIPPVREWPDPLGPTEPLAREAVVGAYRSDLLRIDGQSSPRVAFVWKPTFEEAVAAADGDPNAIGEPTYGGAFYPDSVAWYAWQGRSLGTSVQDLQAHLAARLAAWLATRQGQTDLLAFAQELIAAETRRYLQDQLDARHLPEVPP